MSGPEVFVCAGGGGVGKTTTSAALALALARSGRRALIVSIDPARRLAEAIGVDLGTEAREVSVDTGDGRLFGLMPDPRQAMRTFAAILFEHEPAALARLLDNRLYQVLEHAVPGIHELAAMSLTWRAAVEHQVDVVVIDTAPSRNAIDFINYPQRLAKLLGGKAVGWLANIAKRSAISRPDAKVGRAERLVTNVLGPVVADVAGLFSEMALVRSHFVLLNERTAELLLGPRTRYYLVAAPTGAAQNDVNYLMTKFSKLGVHPSTLIINAAFVPDRPWVDVLGASKQTTAPMHEALNRLEAEKNAREQASARMVAMFARRHAQLEPLRLPFVEATDPPSIVRALASHLG